SALQRVSRVRRRIASGGNWPNIVLAVTAVTFIIAYLFVALSRVTYPFDLDFIENAMLLQAWRTGAGLPVYLPPNGEFVPQVYMPLYTWLGGLPLRLTGPVFWPLRLLSLLSTLGTAVLLYLIGRQLQPNRAIALVGAALFLAGYKLTGGWYDLARVDALFVFLALAGMGTAVYHHHTNRGLALAGLLMGLALLTKQNGLFLTAVVGAWLLWAVRWRMWLFGAVFLAVTAVPLLLLEWRNGGWFSYYVVDIAYASPVEISRVWPVLRREVLGGMGVLVLMAGGTAVAYIIQQQWRKLIDPPWLVFMGAALFVSVSGRSSVGGNLNNLIIGLALLCLAPALLAGAVRPGKWVNALLTAAILVQFALLTFPPLPYAPQQFRPTAVMRQQGEHLIEYLAEADGEVWVMLHPAYGLQAGKEAGVHIQTLWHARQRGAQPLPPDLVAR
ncbi:MAG TPA: phospholipid carrier-dependent glycosyltransferase, partial [Anaerolineae bacterium]|nr:phospholipid carrier-dependent glycosyltransferase [Anaerolineae bacterium]